MKKTNHIIYLILIASVFNSFQQDTFGASNKWLKHSLAGMDFEVKNRPNPEEKSIISYTDTLYLGDTLKVKFKTPHPKDFAIRTPDNRFFFLVYALSDPEMPSLYDWNEFANMNTIEIITDKTKANPWDASASENCLIFAVTGTYKILLSDKLETDDGTLVETVTVYFVNEKR